MNKHSSAHNSFGNAQKTKSPSLCIFMYNFREDLDPRSQTDKRRFRCQSGEDAYRSFLLYWTSARSSPEAVISLGSQNASEGRKGHVFCREVHSWCASMRRGPKDTLSKNMKNLLHSWVNQSSWDIDWHELSPNEPEVSSIHSDHYSLPKHFFISFVVYYARYPSHQFSF